MTEPTPRRERQQLTDPFRSRLRAVIAERKQRLYAWSETVSERKLAARPSIGERGSRVSRTGQVFFVVGTICLTVAVTVYFTPFSPGTSGPPLWPLWLIGAVAIPSAFLVDTRAVRSRMASLARIHR